MSCSKGKVCSMCGNVGFAERVVTCSTCKKISQHIYCMQKPPVGTPNNWHCEQCTVTHKVKPPRRGTILIDVIDGGKIIPVNRSCPLNSWNASTQPRPLKGSRRAQRVRAKKNLPPPLHCSAKAPGASPSTVVPILGASPAPNNSTEIQTIAISPVTPALKAYEVYSQGIKMSAKPAMHLSRSKIAREAGPCVKEGNANDYQVSGKRDSDVLGNKWPPETPEDPRSHKSPVNDIAVASNNPAVLQSKPEEKKRVARNSKGECCEEIVRKNPAKGFPGTKSHNKSAGLDTIGSSLLYSKKTKILCPVGFSGESCEELVKKNPAEGCSETKSHNKSTGLDTIGSNLPHNEKTKNLSPVGFSGNTASQNSNFARKSLLLLDEMVQYRPVSDTCWKGRFMINYPRDTEYPIVAGILAHFPGTVALKVYETVKELSGKDIRVKLCQRRDVWPKLYRLDPPDYNDVGVYFIPSKEQRLDGTFRKLVDQMDRQDFAMQSSMENLELLIFTSAQLPQDSTLIGVAPDACLWGTFHRIRPRKQAIRDKGKSPLISTGSGSTGGCQDHASECSSQFKATAGTKRPVPEPDVPLANNLGESTTYGFSGSIYPPKRKLNCTTG
ncbi:uncharacterized protein A4U43_C03F21220 [Asparagus officinalis]|uniref:Zinc finger PHD-type domain-containing protein n=1 Tax=Asparagus officinalis TaxID=4686 RepID=A0A5P1FGU0_ASPOF|nr:uncharacterized protein LOC109834155 [Asparagus officinalis]ONK75851.1 uncharacterized protein A4U43_C03F21220 [Asparagus officinalis]